MFGRINIALNFILCLALCLIGLCRFVTANRVRYDGYKVFEIIPRTIEETEIIREWLLANPQIESYNEPSWLGNPVEVLVPPSLIDSFTKTLDNLDATFRVTNENIQISFDTLWMTIEERQQSRNNLNLNQWNQLSDIMAWFDSIPANCSASLICEIYTLGNSFEGRPIKALKISKNEPNRKAYLLDALTHANEWLGGATMLKVIDHMVANYGSDADVTRLMDDYDWYYIPVVNPDGYEYTWTTTRLWRKNRRSSDESVCFGVDLNRNFDFGWGTNGVSHDPCSNQYAGPSGGSEPETQAITNEAHRIGAELRAWFTLHAFGRMWIFPYGHYVNFTGSGPDDCRLVEDHQDLMEVANAAADATQATFNVSEWSRGNACQTIYVTSGTTDDYVKGAGLVKYPYCIELRGPGFDVSEEEIEPSFREFWNGLVAAVDKILEKHGP